MTLQELTQLVALGEGSHLEFKRRVPQPERIAKEVMAFANTHGGRLLLGVDDDGTITGVRDAEEEEFALRRALERHCSPPVTVDLIRVRISRKRDVIIVRVPQSASRPHFLVHDEAGTRVAYVRVEDKSVEASRECLRLMAEPSTNGVTFEFGDEELLLMRYLERYGRVTVKQFARMANIPRRKASNTLVMLTRAEVLRLHAGHRSDYFTLAYVKS